MTRDSETPSESQIGRREAIRRAALLAGLMLSPEALSGLASAQTPAGKSHLTVSQASILRTAADRILPRTDTPGAIDVGVPAFIDRFYGEFMTPAERELLVSVLDEIARVATAAHNTTIAALPVAQQDDVLTRVATAQGGHESPSFGWLRSLTVLGYFTSEQVGRDVLHYDPVPGTYDGCVPIDQVGRRNWTT